MNLRILILTATFTSTAFPQGGPLTPPAGVPVPTMKSLDQIEARTAIPKSPDVPIAGPHYTISLPGSYYLTGNVEVASGNGINITASNVTLDLNGFALISKTVSPASGNAINIGAGVRSIEIKNGRFTGGSVRTHTGPNPWDATFADQGWSTGIQDDDGIPANGVILSHLTLEQCGSYAMILEGTCVLSHIAANNNGNGGIYANTGTLTNVNASNNNGHGIELSAGSVTNATVTNNSGQGIFALAISVTNATASTNGSHGIFAVRGSVFNAAATSNGGNGISAANGSVSNAYTAFNGEEGIFAPGASVTNSSAFNNFRTGISVGVGVAAHCVASGNSTDPMNSDKEIDVSAGGQRAACVPASE